MNLVFVLPSTKGIRRKNGAEFVSLFLILVTNAFYLAILSTASQQGTASAPLYAVAEPTGGMLYQLNLELHHPVQHPLWFNSLGHGIFTQITDANANASVCICFTCLLHFYPGFAIFTSWQFSAALVALVANWWQ
ncbi:hypothetical protein C8J56DRAFT_879422 [Mycena floridula]|nr:hypothetical protein C8J56DRAFT_879422 [Mycena floridula]